MFISGGGGCPRHDRPTGGQLYNNFTEIRVHMISIWICQFGVGSARGRRTTFRIHCVAQEYRASISHFSPYGRWSRRRRRPTVPHQIESHPRVHLAVVGDLIIGLQMLIRCGGGRRHRGRRTEGLFYNNFTNIRVYMIIFESRLIITIQFRG